MENIWIYEVEQQAKGIVVADSEYNAIEKVVASYKKHKDDICPADIIIVKFNKSDGWFKDSPDVLEVTNIN